MSALEILTAAADQLNGSGSAMLQYITAEFSPFSSQFQPDLVFHPTDLPGHVFFVEYRDASSRIFQDSLDTLCQQLIEHREFISVEPGLKLHFAIASDRTDDPKLLAALEKCDIAYLAPVPTPESLVKSVITWTGKVPRPIS